MTEFWDKIKRNIVETLNEAIDKTEELTSVGRTKLEILQLEHQINEKYAEMGKLVHRHYDQYAESFPRTGKLPELNKKIEELEEKLHEKEKELERIREEEGIDFDS
jgi:seryl-tRNA synthetase